MFFNKALNLKGGKFCKDISENFCKDWLEKKIKFFFTTETMSIVSKKSKKQNFLKTRFNFKTCELLILKIKKLTQLKLFEHRFQRLALKLKLSKSLFGKLNKIFFYRKRFLLKQLQKKNKKFRNWLRQKKQKKLSLFLYKYNKAVFFKKYRYRFKLLQYFFFRYTYSSKKIFSILAKKSKMWFWGSISRYLNIEFFFKYQLYFFLKQLDFFKVRKQYSLRTKLLQFYFLSFKKLKTVLNNFFLKINNIKVVSPFYQIFSFDLLELSYAKFFQHITAFANKKYQKTKVFFRRSLVGEHLANYNFLKRFKLKKYRFSIKKTNSKKIYFNFFRFLKFGFHHNYLNYVGLLLKFFKHQKFYFFRFFFFERYFLFKDFETFCFNLKKKHKNFYNILFNQIKKKKKKKFFLLRYRQFQLFKQKKLLLWFSKFRYIFLKFLFLIFRFRRFKLKFFTFLPQKFKVKKKKNKVFKIFKKLSFSLGKYFNRYYSWYERKLKRDYKIYLFRQKRINFILKVKKLFFKKDKIKSFFKQAFRHYFFFLQKRKSKYYLKYFLFHKKFKKVPYFFKKLFFKNARKRLIKRILFFKILFIFFKSVKKKFKQKNLFNFQKNYISSFRTLAYIPLLLKQKKKKLRKLMKKKKIFFLKSRDLRLLYFNGIYESR